MEKNIKSFFEWVFPKKIIEKISEIEIVKINKPWFSWIKSIHIIETRELPVFYHTPNGDCNILHDKFRRNYDNM